MAIRRSVTGQCTIALVLALLCVPSGLGLKTIGVELVDESVPTCAGGRGVVNVVITNYLTSSALLELDLQGQGAALFKDAKHYNLGMRTTEVLKLPFRVPKDKSGPLEYTITAAIKDTSVAVKTTGTIKVTSVCPDSECVPLDLVEDSPAATPVATKPQQPLVVRSKGYTDRRTMVFAGLVALALVLAALSVVRTGGSTEQQQAPVPVTTYYDGGYEGLSYYYYRNHYPAAGQGGWEGQA